MKRSKNVEFDLKRKIRELEAIVKKLQNENKILQKNKEKTVEVVGVPKSKISAQCPDCAAPLKDCIIPSGILVLCSKACGYKEVKPKKGHNNDYNERTKL